MLFVIAVEFFLTCIRFAYHIVIAIIYSILPRKAKNVEGDIVLITGAANGIGKIVAKKFADLNATLVLWDIDKKANENVAREIEVMGKRAYAYTVDVTQKESVYKVANRVKMEVGDVNILINNAGIVSGKKLLDCDDDMIIRTMEVNMISHFWTVKAFLPAMLENNEGHIVTIASAAGLLGVSQLVDYSASKHGAIGFDESLRHELTDMHSGINTTVVCPYYTDTGLFYGCKSRFPKILPILEPEYVASCIVDAILQNQHILFVPKILSIFIFLKTILPTSAFIVLGKFFGGFTFMDNFQGRAKKNFNRKF
ncbi:Epidermal retinol dehydrogenase 2 [Trichoplax sp. H2]|uniref:Epidermal retinol dehydrogenase 2 n=1 Tax=Trichoplax adhaerens TaxID=10228 RepID=B3SD16_TRIAD|nr:hypothetical protein TRIADDRAFT_33710 [Trichoplax adhaerens]EDV19359.1 hypothetical protein TRIADDRAFT_33710 [Trichoplax adhaerens]RDD38150.1 Epidermal retinol dehydrogenase 2 [Trichoplax sp. H2]|eukprot:XP_002118134.1 hypothetical protein TRIADDRAFT_33710 [Trichoplax adhaerens]